MLLLRAFGFAGAVDESVARRLEMVLIMSLWARLFGKWGALGTRGEVVRAETRRALFYRGEAAVKRGDLNEAEAAFERILKSNPSDGLAHFNLGSVFVVRSRGAIAAGNMEKAEREAEQALLHFDAALDGSPTGPDLALLASSRILVRLGRPQSAQKRLNRFLQSNQGTSEQHAEAQQLLIEANHCARYVQGTSAVSPYIELARSESEHSQERVISLHLGIELLEAFLRDEPNNWSAHWFIGKAHQALGNHDASIDAFEAAYRIHPDNPDVGRELAIEALELGRFERAVVVAKAAMARSPHDPGLGANLALALLLSGDVLSAAAEIEAAHAADLEDVITRRLRAMILDVRDGRRSRPTNIRDVHAMLSA